MGNEAICILRYGGKSFSGSALLETSEVLFRGDLRLKIPFSSISKVQAKDGALHICIKDGLAIFELGDKSEKWRDKITNPKSRLDKLGIKQGNRVSLMGKFPANFLDELRIRGVALTADRLAKDAGWIFLAAETSKDLARIKPIAKSLGGAAALWIIYPKGQESITENDVRSAGLSAGLTDIKVTSFSPTHTGLKFVIPRANR